MSARRIVLWTAFLALAAGIGVNLLAPAGVASFSHSHPFATLAPAAPPGWEVRDTPLGTTELAADDAASVLNFDDFFCKTYRKNGMEVTVYAAYWSPGRQDPSLVEGHIPDICWVGAGGTIVERDDNRVLTGFGNSVFRPGRFRVFEFPRRREEVIFWHCFAGKPVRLADAKTSPLWGPLRRFGQVFRITGFGLSPREQIFVRVSTNRTFDDLFTGDLWPALTSSLLPSGIFEPVALRARAGQTVPSR